MSIQTTLNRRRVDLPSAMLIVLSALSFLLLLYPTFYTNDSAELTIGAATLGIVHAPGYALYTLTAHLFTLLPLGDVGLRVNLFSAVCMILTAPFLYAALRELTASKVAAFATAGYFIWTFSSWGNGTVAEVYASQLLTLSICLYCLCWLAKNVTRPHMLAAAISYGVAVAMHPSSIFFAPAIALIFLSRRVSLRWCVGAGLIAFVVFVVSLLYFPLRQHAGTALNLAGYYTTAGEFRPTDLGSLDGLWWLISGRQFSAFFFTQGFVPSLPQLGQFVGFVWTNFLGIGVVLGLAGIVALSKRRRLLALWLVAFIPYTYFYTLYGASDRETMLGPTYLLWCIPLCFGLMLLERALPPRLSRLLVLLPIIPFALNLPLLIARNQVSTRTYAQTTIDALPPNATVFGLWGDLMPIQYLQIIEGQRPDLDLRNLILFDSRETVVAFVRTILLDPAQRPIVFLGIRAPIGLDTKLFNMIPFRTAPNQPTLGYALQRRKP